MYNIPNNILLVSTIISMWIYNNLPRDLVNYLANLFEMVGQNLSSMLTFGTNNNNSCTQ